MSADILKHPAIKHRRLRELHKALKGSTEAQILAALEPALALDTPKTWFRQRPVYLKALAGLPPDILDAAVWRAIETIKWFPKVAELMELSNSTLERRRSEYLVELDKHLPPPCSPSTSSESWHKHCDYVLRKEPCPNCEEREQRRQALMQEAAD